jgi:hypothetical protein
LSELENEGLKGKFSIIIIKLHCQLSGAQKKGFQPSIDQFLFVVFSHHVSSYSSYTLVRSDMTFEMLGRNPSHVDVYQDSFSFSIC